MSPLLRLFMTELKFQWRYGFFASAAVVTLVWALLLGALPESLRPFWFGIVTILDVASIGLMFGFGLGVLDKNQQTIIAIRLTPIRSWMLAVGRVATLSLLMIVTLTVLSLLLLTDIAPLPLLLGIVLLSVFFSTLGVTTARRFSTVNQFMIFFSLSGIVWGLPALFYADLIQSNVWIVLPSAGAVVLLKAALSTDVAPLLCFVATTIQIVWICIIFELGERWAPKNLEHRFGGH